MNSITKVPISCKVRRLLILLYGASTCFETFALAGSSRNYTLSFIMAIIYVLSLVPFLGDVYSILNRYLRYIRPFFLFFILLCLMNWFNENQYNVPIISISILSCFTVFMCMLIHSKNDPHAITYCMYGYMIGAVLLSVLYVMGIGVHMELGIDIAEDERISMFGLNQNGLGMTMVNGITLIVLYIIMYNKWNIGIWRYLSILLIVPMVTLMFAAASRAAFIALAVIMVCFVFLYKTKHFFTRILFIIIGFIGIWFAYEYFISSDSLMYVRIMQTIEEGNSSGRVDIWDKLMPRLMESPLLGVGQTGYSLISHQVLMSLPVAMYENGYSPHNVLIEIFAYTGIVGLAFMLIFWFRLACDSIVCYRKANNLIPLLLLIPVAVFIMTGQILSNKFAWVLYAYIAVQGYNIKYHQQ